MIGIVLGFIFNKSNQKKSQVSIAYKFKDSISERFEDFCINLVYRQGVRRVLYALGSALIVFSMLANHIFVDYHEEGKEIWFRGLLGLWVAANRILFTLGFCFFAFPLVFGFNSAIASVLRMKVFRFLAKISYGLYIIHPLVFFHMYMPEDDNYQRDSIGFLRMFVGIVFNSVLVTSVLQVLIECPFLNLAKKYLSR